MEKGNTKVAPGVLCYIKSGINIGKTVEVIRRIYLDDICIYDSYVLKNALDDKIWMCSGSDLKFHRDGPGWPIHTGNISYTYEESLVPISGDSLEEEEDVYSTKPINTDIEELV